jgi:outer membrane murein-binding lipoprotein Lpp
MRSLEMSVSRERLEGIAEVADEAAGVDGWTGHKMSLLASWVRDLAAAVAALDEEAEQHEAEIGALSDAVDEIDARIDEHLEAEDFADRLPDDVFDDFQDTIDLTAAPYVLDLELEDNFACFEGGKLHVGAAFHHALLMARAAKESDTKQFGIGDVVRLARHDERHGSYCIPAEVFFEVGTVLDGPDEWGDYRVMFGRVCRSFAVKPEMLDRVQAA